MRKSFKNLIFTFYFAEIADCFEHFWKPVSPSNPIRKLTYAYSVQLYLYAYLLMRTYLTYKITHTYSSLLLKSVIL